MMATYKEDMSKTLAIMAIRKGLSVTYENQSDDARIKRSNQQNLARQKRYNKENHDPNGPPDTKKKFNPGKNVIYTITILNACVATDKSIIHKSSKPKSSFTLNLKTNDFSGLK